MFITTLDANVEPDKWDELKVNYGKLTETVPTQIVQTLLTQNAQENNAWKLIAIWRSKAELMEYRKAAQKPTPEGILLFRSVGAEPVSSLSDVRGNSKYNP